MGEPTRAHHDDLDFDACECDNPLVASEVADWMVGNPTGYYCEKCGYTFVYRGGYEP